MTLDSTLLTERLAAQYIAGVGTDPGGVLILAFAHAQIEGDLPHARMLYIRTGVDERTLLPIDAVVERSATDDTTTQLLASCAQGLAYIISTPLDCVVSVCAPTPELATELAESIRARVPSIPTDDTVAISTWYRTGERVQQNVTRVDAPEWAAIAHNYSKHTRHALDELVGLRRPQGRGRLILLHGEAGTGKTTALRSLVRAWQPWCVTHYVTDPDRFFRETGYLLQVLTTPLDQEPPGPDEKREADRWRLVVAEDTDESLWSSRGRNPSAGLGRLLNLTDGVLGQGHDAIVLLTTNAPLRDLHPAISRPGRSLACIEFERFSPTEVRAWLGTSPLAPTLRPTLAELFELRGDLNHIGGSHNDQPTGQYL